MELDFARWDSLQTALDDSEDTPRDGCICFSSLRILEGIAVRVLAWLMRASARDIHTPNVSIAPQVYSLLPL